MKKALIATILLIIATPAFAERIVCASTTSTQNSGLFDHILPLFEKKTGITVSVVAVGTGAALELGRRGDADVVLVHARELELKAVRDGFFTERKDVMYNDFIIVGPPGDPANLKEAASATDAFRAIASNGALFVSRGDRSGTHMRELKIWRSVGINPGLPGGPGTPGIGEKWYLEVGQGMSKTLMVADEKNAHTLTDRGTWLSLQRRLRLMVLFEGDPALVNQYGVMAVSPKRHHGVKFKESLGFIDWLVSKEGQGAIGSFRDAGGNRLFVPNAN